LKSGSVLDNRLLVRRVPDIKRKLIVPVAEPLVSDLRFITRSLAQPPTNRKTVKKYWVPNRNFFPSPGHATKRPMFQAKEPAMLYRAYLLENGHTYAAIDLTCVDDDDAKRQTANLSNGRDVELWQGDRRIALLGSRRKVLAGSHSAGLRR
jgi:hypothetical protein